MESIKVTTEELRQKSEEVSALATEYFQHYEALLNDVATLTTTDWTGNDANAFREQVEGFRADFNNMKEKMEDYANFLRTAAVNYDETQSNVINVIKSLQN